MLNRLEILRHTPKEVSCNTLQRPKCNKERYPVQQGALALLDDLTEVQVHHQFTTACFCIVYILLVTDDVKEVRAWKRVTHFAFCFEDEGFFEDRIQHKGAVDAVVILEDSPCTRK